MRSGVAAEAGRLGLATPAPPSHHLTHASPLSHTHTHHALVQAQAQQRGVKQAASTQPDPDDPLKERYGDGLMVQSREVSGKVYNRVEHLTPELAGQTVRRGGGEGGQGARRHVHAMQSTVRRTPPFLPPPPAPGLALTCVFHALPPPPSPSWQVLVRTRLHTVRGKGKSAFLVLRQRMATVQVCVGWG